ncbi:MAG: VCBS repeat-containing protein [Myxococcales bacterium]|nr:VCBS repeat-containing protein [Myxococcales bacterium]
MKRRFTSAVIGVCVTTALACSASSRSKDTESSEPDDAATDGTDVATATDITNDTDDVTPDIVVATDVDLDGVDPVDTPDVDAGGLPDVPVAPDVTPDVPADPDTTGGIVLAGIQPAEGTFRGGAIVAITGAGLGAATEVHFGSRAALIEASGPASLSVRVPASLVGGLVDVTVRNATGSAALERAFRYVGISPAKLRLVEVPGQVDAAPVEHLVPLQTTTGHRLASFGVSGAALLGPTPDGRLTQLWSEPPPLLPGEDGAPGTVLGTIDAACAADFDGDGDADPWVDGSAGTGLRLHAGDTLAAATGTVDLGAYAAVCTDVTDDDQPDVVYLRQSPGGATSLAIIAGLGAGALSPPVTGLTFSSVPLDLAVADVDGDGDGDVVVTRAGGPCRLLLGDGFGSFVDAPAGSLPVGGDGARVAATDLTGDGLPDLALIGPKGTQLWVNEGGTFADESSLAVAGPSASVTTLRAVDLDVDGAMDLVALATSGPIVLRNDGTGRLFDYSGVILPRAGSPVPQRIAALDADGDFDPDLVVASAGQVSPTLLRAWDPLPFIDPDADGLPSELDFCPDDYDPLQENTDVPHFQCTSAESCAAKTGCTLHISPTDFEGGFGPRAYLYCPQLALTQGAALDWCQKRGAQLARFASMDEQTYVVSFGSGRTWFDASDAVSEGNWVDSTGTPVPYTDWGNGQPDNAGGEHCVELIPADPTAGDLWNDLPCSQPRGLVCEDVVAELNADPADACDTCPLVHDPDQKDSDGDGIGDACEVGP